MKKIQVTAVELKSQSEVIVLNSSFVANSVRAADAAKRIKAKIEDDSARYVRDEEGNVKKDENGKSIREIKVGESSVGLSPAEVLDFYERIEPFVTELAKALLGEEA